MSYRIKWEYGATFPERFYELGDAKVFLIDFEKKHGKVSDEIGHRLIIIEE